MISPARLIILSGVLCAGCQTAGKVAVTSFRVIDAPARYIREKIDSSDSTTTTTTTTTTGVSDVANPGGPVTASTPPPRRVVTQHRPTTSASIATTKPHTEANAAKTQRTPTASSTPRSSATAAAQFPTAKPVPGKPGYVYSVDPKGGIVDVTGYKSGDKAKDPYTQQVFIVP